MAVIRNVVVKIGADIGDLQKALQSATKELDSIGKEWSKVGSTLTTNLSLPLAVIGGAALKTAADFEEGMSKIKALSGASGQEMQQLQALALQMGKDTKYSAVEAATGIEELAKAGLTTGQILDGGLKGALALASAGGVELADAAEIASTALNAFKADSLSVIDAANILAGAANASATDVYELKYGLASVAAVASSVGMSFNDTTTALAVFAQNGLKGSDAGTSLKTMLLNLQPSTKAQTELFSQLSLTTADGASKFFDASGKLKSLSDISGILQQALSGLTDAQRLQTMETLFGTDAIRAANILYKEGTTGVTTMKAAIGNVTAEQVATEKMNNLKGSAEQLRGSVETLGIKLGTVLIPLVNNLVDRLTDWTNKLIDLSPQMQQGILITGALVMALGPLLMIVGSVANGISVLISVLGLLISPVGLVVIAIAGAVAALVILWNTNETVRQALIVIWNNIQEVAMTIFNALQVFWTNYSSDIMELFKYTWEFIFALLKKCWQDIKFEAEFVFYLLKDLWTVWGDEVTMIFNNAWYTIRSIFEGVLDIITGLMKLFTGAITSDWSLCWDGFTQITQGAWQAITGIIHGAANGIIGMINMIISAFNSIHVSIPEWVPGLGGSSFGISIPKVPYLAKGGIVSSPTLAMIGEAGPEAVVPLDKMSEMGSSGVANIIVELDGRVLAKALGQPFVDEIRLRTGLRI